MSINTFKLTSRAMVFYMKPHALKQNGIVDQKNQHILEIAHALLIGAHVSSSYWDDAIATTIHLLNRMPSKVVNFKIPLHVLSSYVSLPIVLFIPPRVFGCVVFAHLHKNQQSNLDLYDVRCSFLGMLYRKRAIVVTIPSLSALMLLWMLPS